MIVLEREIPEKLTFLEVILKRLTEQSLNMKIFMLSISHYEQVTRESLESIANGKILKYINSIIYCIIMKRVMNGGHIKRKNPRVIIKREGFIKHTSFS